MSENLGKRKRTAWPEDILNDVDVEKVCEYGKWIECKVCKKMYTIEVFSKLEFQFIFPLPVKKLKNLKITNN